MNAIFSFGPDIIKFFLKMVGIYLDSKKMKKLYNDDKTDNLNDDEKEDIIIDDIKKKIEKNDKLFKINDIFKIDKSWYSYKETLPIFIINIILVISYYYIYFYKINLNINGNEIGIEINENKTIKNIIFIIMLYLLIWNNILRFIIKNPCRYKFVGQFFFKVLFNKSISDEKRNFNKLGNQFKLYKNSGDEKDNNIINKILTSDFDGKVNFRYLEIGSVYLKNSHKEKEIIENAIEITENDIKLTIENDKKEINELDKKGINSILIKFKNEKYIFNSGEGIKIQHTLNGANYYLYFYNLESNLVFFSFDIENVNINNLALFLGLHWYSECRENTLIQDKSYNYMCIFKKLQFLNHYSNVKIKSGENLDEIMVYSANLMRKKRINFECSTPKIDSCLYDIIKNNDDYLGWIE